MNKRIENLDILRCFAMLMIVILHVVGQGGVMEIVKKRQMLSWGTVYLLQYACLCSVNVFMLLSGFLGRQIQFRYSRIVMLYLQTLFWSFTMSIVIHLIYPDYIHKISFFRYIPLYTIYYWFFTSYFIVFFLMPMINFIVNNWNKKDLQKAIITFFVIFCILTGTSIGFHSLRGRNAFLLNGGYSPIWLAYVYFLGSFLSKYGITSLLPENLTLKIKKVTYNDFNNNYYMYAWGGYFIIMFSGFAHIYITSHIHLLNKFYSPSCSYNDPYILLMSVFLFEAFRRTRFPSWANVLGRICAPYAFGVFLIHTQYDCYTLLENAFTFIVKYNILLYIPTIIAYSLGIFIVCCFMDWIRALLFNFLQIKIILKKLLNET